MVILSSEHVVTIANALIGAAREEGLELTGYARDQAEAYRNCCNSVGQLLHDGIIDNVTATRAVETFRLTQVFVLQNIEELEELMAKKIVNAGLKAVGGIVNGVSGLKLFPE